MREISEPILILSPRYIFVAIVYVPVDRIPLMGPGVILVMMPKNIYHTPSVKYTWVDIPITSQSTQHSSAHISLHKHIHSLAWEMLLGADNLPGFERLMREISVVMKLNLECKI
jgi:hypothetical protein